MDYNKILDRDGYVCHICGGEILRNVPPHHPLSLHFDHIIPLAKGGTHTEDNIAVAHARCNLSKNDRIIPSVKTPRKEEDD